MRQWRPGEYRRLSLERRAELQRQWQEKSQVERQQSLRELRERIGLN